MLGRQNQNDLLLYLPLSHSLYSGTGLLPHSGTPEPFTVSITWHMLTSFCPKFSQKDQLILVLQLLAQMTLSPKLLWLSIQVDAPIIFYSIHHLVSLCQTLITVCNYLVYVFVYPFGLYPSCQYVSLGRTRNLSVCPPSCCVSSSSNTAWHVRGAHDICVELSKE